MPRDLFASKALSGGTLNSLAKATRSICDISDDLDFDIIRFLEIDILKITPDFHLFVEQDEFMNGGSAFIANDSTSIVVSESVYNDACAGYFYARKILAHEFGHILLHHNLTRETKHFTRASYSKEIRGAEPYHSAEWQADTFSILLILPQRDIKRGLSKKEISSKYKISDRQSDFIANRLASLRTRINSYNREDTQRVINEFLDRFRGRRQKTNIGEIQMSMFA